MATIQRAIELRTAGQPEEAKEILLGLLAQSPDDPDILYQLAWVHDLMGLEGEAVPYYEQAISSGLKDPERCGALLGLGSTYRTLGMYHKSKGILEQGLLEYPEAREFNVFYAMTLYNLGQYDKSMALLLKEVGETSNDEGIKSYRKAIAFYSDKLDQIWK
ncbi:tetratricopeptide repeat protein [Paenibacillus sp. NPDC093718]|uniref:tetratricopeptide repeat protein n=1 Tax=Paenibacillus sp. NPDC093718 TaxID=3390601 RepID=UPI003CFBD05B